MLTSLIVNDRNRLAKSYLTIDRPLLMLSERVTGACFTRCSMVRRQPGGCREEIKIDRL